LEFKAGSRWEGGESEGRGGEEEAEEERALAEPGPTDFSNKLLLAAPAQPASAGTR